MNLRELFIAASVAKNNSIVASPEQINQAVKDYLQVSIGGIEYPAVFGSILELLKHATYDSNMSDSLDKLEALIKTNDDEPVYKWVVGLNGSSVSGTNEALLNKNYMGRAMCLAEGTGIPITYGADYQPTEMSSYSPVVIPEGAVSVTVKCHGFKISFNELKLVDGKWFRLFNSDTDPVADEVTYSFQFGLAKALFIKLRNATNSNLEGVPEVPDITFHY